MYVFIKLSDSHIERIILDWLMSLSCSIKKILPPFYIYSVFYWFIFPNRFIKCWTKSNAARVHIPNGILERFLFHLILKYPDNRKKISAPENKTISEGKIWYYLFMFSIYLRKKMSD